MTLTSKDYSAIREELDECTRPIYFFGDDSDGLCSFLLLYRYKREGRGVCVKAKPKLDSKFLNVVEDYQPDKAFILDVPLLDQDFVDAAKIPMVWIDHHPPIEVRKVKYFNPRKDAPQENICTTHLCYNVVKDTRPQDIWIAMLGIVGDWQLPADLAAEFSEKYPDLLSPDVKRPEEALFDTPLGKLVRFYNFILNGKTQDVNQTVKILTRIDDPYEIINRSSARARLIGKRFDSINTQYEALLNEAVASVRKDDPVLLFTYTEDKMSFTGPLANELLYRYPKKIIVIARKRSGEMKCSLRSAGKVHIAPMVDKALIGVDGHGGGHEHACGASIKEEHFDKFVAQLRAQIG
ncbi:DHH family phosphoesterase [Candidatus Woesearchaeota archaeon]|nr:DHH family phosphoesterase [Candidatus Woesearchaeota archaeon]